MKHKIPLRIYIYLFRRDYISFIPSAYTQTHVYIYVYIPYIYVEMPGTAPPCSINKGTHFASDYEKKN